MLVFDVRRRSDETSHQESGSSPQLSRRARNVLQSSCLQRINLSIWVFNKHTGHKNTSLLILEETMDSEIYKVGKFLLFFLFYIHVLCLIYKEYRKIYIGRDLRVSYSSTSYSKIKIRSICSGPCLVESWKSLGMEISQYL